MSNAFYDTQKRVYDALQGMRFDRIDPTHYLLVMHPDRWVTILRDTPVSYGYADSTATRLFGFDVFLDSSVPEGYIALRHEVRA